MGDPDLGSAQPHSFWEGSPRATPAPSSEKGRSSN